MADKAVKTGNVTLLRIHLAMALGVRGFVVMTGDISIIAAPVEAGRKAAAAEGMLVASGTILAPGRGGVQGLGLSNLLLAMQRTFGYRMATTSGANPKRREPEAPSDIRALKLETALQLTIYSDLS